MGTALTEAEWFEGGPILAGLGGGLGGLASSSLDQGLSARFFGEEIDGYKIAAHTAFGVGFGVGARLGLRPDGRVSTWLFRSYSDLVTRPVVGNVLRQKLGLTALAGGIDSMIEELGCSSCGLDSFLGWWMASDYRLNYLLDQYVANDKKRRAAGGSFVGISVDGFSK